MNFIYNIYVYSFAFLSELLEITYLALFFLGSIIITGISTSIELLSQLSEVALMSLSLMFSLTAIVLLAIVLNKTTGTINNTRTGSTGSKLHDDKSKKVRPTTLQNNPFSNLRDYVRRIFRK